MSARLQVRIHPKGVDVVVHGPGRVTLSNEDARWLGYALVNASGTTLTGEGLDVEINKR